MKVEGFHSTKITWEKDGIQSEYIFLDGFWYKKSSYSYVRMDYDSDTADMLNWIMENANQD